MQEERVDLLEGDKTLVEQRRKLASYSLVSIIIPRYNQDQYSLKIRSS